MKSIPDLAAYFDADKVWYTSDFHHGDPRRELLGRPLYVERMDDFFVDNWNRVVGKNDLVVVVGDWCVDEESLQITSRFNGQKILLRGNYDRLPDEKYLEAGFAMVLPEDEGLYTIIRDENGKDIPVHIVHYPSLSSPDAFNLCGHIHGCWRVQKNMLNVGVDVHNYTPIDNEKVLFYYKGIHDFYDQDVWVASHLANVVHASRGKRSTYFESQFAGSLNHQSSPTKG